MATQAERTAETTARLLDATIATLVERGYRGASTPEICRRAGVSRGAQLHHFPTKEVLVAAAVEHLLAQRIDDLAQRIAARIANAGSSGAVDLEDAAANLWAIYTSDTFYAWLELVIASRTDPHLRKIVSDLDLRLVEKAEAVCLRFLLPHVEDKREIAATTRLILAIFDGLATHRILAADDTIVRRALHVAAKAGLFQPRTAK